MSRGLELRVTSDIFGRCVVINQLINRPSGMVKGLPAGAARQLGVRKTVNRYLHI